MVNIRNYGAGTISALVSLSQGTCYWPNCGEPIVRFVDGVPVNNFETAHIRAANQGGRRYVAAMTDEERNQFDNLVLLCAVHHKVVDKLRPNDFSIETLHEWKNAREGSGKAVLQGLRGLTEDRLQQLISESLLSFKSQMGDAISRLEAIDLEAAKLLKPLIDELTEGRFHTRLPNEDVAGMLADAAGKLANLEDSASVLADAAKDLANLEDAANTLSAAANDLRGLEEVAAAISVAAHDMQQARADM